MSQPGSPPSPPPSRDVILRGIIWVLVGDVLIGAFLVVAGEYIWPSRILQYTGLALVLVGGALYFFFRWLERREAARRGEP